MTSRLCYTQHVHFIFKNMQCAFFHYLIRLWRVLPYLCYHPGFLSLLLSPSLCPKLSHCFHTSFPSHICFRPQPACVHPLPLLYTRAKQGIRCAKRNQTVTLMEADSYIPTLLSPGICRHGCWGVIAYERKRRYAVRSIAALLESSGCLVLRCCMGVNVSAIQ